MVGATDGGGVTRLLAIAEWLCGADVRRVVFEPLVADWQRELQEGRHHGPWRVGQIVASGGMAYAVTLAGCAMTGGWLPSARASMVAALTFFVALKASFIALWMLSLPRGFTTDLGSVQTQSFLLSFAGPAAALVLLPVVFIMRRDPRTTARHALTVIALGAALTAAIVTLTSQEALNRHFSTFASVERQYQRDLAADRAGRVTYPGTAVRHLRGPSTIDQRRANYERFMAWRAEQEAKRPPLTAMQRLRRLQPVALAVLFGVIGWTLAGLGAPSIGRAVAWWALMFVAVLAFGSMPRTLTGVAMPIMPHAYALPLFGAVTLALVAAHVRKQQRTQSTQRQSF